MTWEELEAKHDKQWKDYHTAKDKEHLGLTVKHQELHEAFLRSDDGMPLAIKERMRDEWNDYEKKWSGTAAKELRAEQKKEVGDWLKLEKFKMQLEQQAQHDARRGRDHEL